MKSETLAKDARDMARQAERYYSTKPEQAVEGELAVQLLDYIADIAEAQAERIDAVIYTEEEFEDYETRRREALEAITD